MANSRFEFLQSWLRHRNSYNARVDAFFREIEGSDHIVVSAAKDKEACKITDEDSALTTIIAMLNFYFVQQDLLGEIRNPLIYGLPIEEYQQKYVFRNPQVKLFFHLDKKHNPAQKPQLTHSEIGFRLMDETFESMNKNKAAILAKKIKSIFTNPLFIWEKGKYIATYTDPYLGYRLKIYCRNEGEGERVIRNVLNTRDHPFNFEKFQFIEHRRTYPANPGTHFVYGETVQKPKQRPEISVKFSYAHLFVWGRGQPIHLVDASNRFTEVIERA